MKAERKEAATHQITPTKGQHHLTEINQWIYKESPAPTDIIWNLFCTKFSLYNSIFSLLLTLILFLLVIVCVTPISFLSHISSFK